MAVFEPFVFQASHDKRARIAVYADDAADQNVNRLLFGKFTEHLGTNVYNGVWAQNLRNPVFASWDFFRSTYNTFASGNPEQLKRFQDFSTDRIAAARDAGVACWWMPFGSEHGSYHLESSDTVSGQTCQRIEVHDHGVIGGLEQEINLPVHRCLDYQFRLRCRGDVGELVVSVSAADSEFALITLNLSADDWQDIPAKLFLNDEARDHEGVFSLRIYSRSKGTFWLDCAELFPLDHISGFDPDIVHLVSRSGVSIYRFPGGNFVSGYDWRDGVGPKCQRPVRLNRAWGDCIETNHVGTDEHLEFCRRIGAEPLICINAGDGNPEQAAAWVEYCNGSVDTPMGKMRADNGHPEPYGVKYWEVGNELYGPWQIGHCSATEYAERYQAFRSAMLEADPSLFLVANGQNVEWNQPLLTHNGQQVECMSTHTLEGSDIPVETNPDDVFLAFMGLTSAYDRHLLAMHTQAADPEIRPTIAITELQTFTNKKELPNNKTLTESLFLAGILHSAIRSANVVELITHSALVNHAGGLSKVREVVYPDPVHWTSHLYGNLPISRVVRTELTGPTFSVSCDGLPPVENAPYLDCLSFLALDKKELVVLVINRHPHENLFADMVVTGFTFSSTARVEQIGGDSYMDRNTVEQPDNVEINRFELAVDPAGFSSKFPKHSITAIRLQRSFGE